MLDWLLRKRQGGAEADGPAKRAAASPAPLPAAPPDAPAEGGDGFAPFAAALGLEVPAPAVPTPEEAAEDARIAERVLEHFGRNKPGPASFPSLSLSILNLLANPDVDVRELSRLIDRDPGMAAAILRVANSVAYAGLSPTQTIREAVARLGMREVAKVAGAISARTLFNPRARAELALFPQLWTGLFHEATTVAMAAAALALRTRGARSDLVYLGGMLHDVGKSTGLRSLVALVLDEQLPRTLTPTQVARVLGRVHVEIGVACHQEWNLPDFLRTVCLRHHEPQLAASAELVDLHLVRLVSALHLLRTSPGLHPAAPAEVVDSARALALTPPAVRALDTEIRQAAARVAGSFELEVRPSGAHRPVAR